MKRLAIIGMLALTTACGSLMPKADAGSDQTVTTGDVVTLDASGSIDYYKKALSYHWEFTSKPTGSHATIDNPDTVNPTFTPDVDGSYVLQVSASNSDWTDTATVTITALPASVDASSGTVSVMVLYDATTIDGWLVGKDAANAATIIAQQYPALVDGWNNGTISATNIDVPTADAYSPSLYTVSNGQVVKK